MLEHLEELSHFEDLGPLQSLACVLDAHQSYGVLSNFNDSPSLRTLQGASGCVYEPSTLEQAADHAATAPSPSVSSCLLVVRSSAVECVSECSTDANSGWSIALATHALCIYRAEPRTSELHFSAWSFL